MSFFRRKPSPDELWQWFRANKQRLQLENFADPMAFRQLSQQFRNIQKGLTYEIRHGEVHEMEISADGIPELIPTVRSLVDEAPAIEGWKFIAFRQPRDTPAEIDVFGQLLTAKNIKFSVDQSKDGLLDITVYVPGLTDANYRHLAHCAMMIMESVVGELDLMTKIDEILYEPERQHLEVELRPVSALASALG